MRGTEDEGPRRIGHATGTDGKMGFEHSRIGTGLANDTITRVPAFRHAGNALKDYP